MRCIICMDEKDGSKEHIIPEAMGNKNFITYKVCHECNNKLGAKVDNYLTDYIITKIIRKELGLFGKEKDDIKIFPSNVTDTKGDKFLFKNDIPYKAPKVELGQGILHIEAENIEEGFRLAKRKLERCGFSSDKIEKILKNYKKKEIIKYQPTFQIPADLDWSRYLLAGIKIAYEFACEVLDDLYINDTIANKLRKVLYNAAFSDGNILSIDYQTIKKYSSLLQDAPKKLIEKIKPLLITMNPPVRHICILHGNTNNQLICEVILLLEDIMSFTVLLSKNAVSYGMKMREKMAFVLENGEMFII